MGRYDSSQIADLVGLYILHLLNRIISSEQLGLYRDDGITYIPNSNGPNSSSIQKKIIRAFKLLGCKIEISSKNKIVNFLDVTLELSNNTYKSFIKMDQSPSYININSNHPKNCLDFSPFQWGFEYVDILLEIGSKKFKDCLGYDLNCI